MNYDPSLIGSRRTKHKNPEILYDFEAWRLNRLQVPELFSENQGFPKQKLGQAQIAPFNDASKIVLVNYCIEFLSSGYASVQFVLNDPNTGKEIRQTIYSQKERYMGYSAWRFVCPVKGKDCAPGTVTSLWIGKLGKFACQNCARVRRFAKAIEFYISEFRKNPSYLMKVLESPWETERKKKFALIALEKLTNRFKKMTKNWSTLTETEKHYYKKLIPLIFSKKGYKPSEKLTGESLPFQKMW